MLNGVIVAFGAPRARFAYPVAFVANGTKSFATMTTPEKLSSFSSARYASIEPLAVGARPGSFCEVTQLATSMAAAANGLRRGIGTTSDAAAARHRPLVVFRGRGTGG